MVLGQAYYLTGRHPEALAAFRHALSHHPQDQGLEVYLGLAASYSELGWEEEAQAVIGEILKVNPNFSLEVLRQRLPYQDPVDLEQVIVALRKAGLE